MATTTKRNFNRELRKRRSRAKIFGTADRPRLSVFRSNRYTYAQLIDDSKGHTLASASTKELKKGAKTKTGQAKFLGELVAEKAKRLGVKSVVFSRGFYKFHGRIKAIAESAREAGLKF